MQATTGQSVESLVSAALCGELTDAQARRLAQHGPEIVTLALLAASERIAELQAQAATPQSTPSTPSAMVPVYTKPTTTRRRKKPGARNGHQGTRRAKPTRIDERREHRLERCPDCGGPLNKCRRSRTRIIEDIPEEITPVVTEHTLHRDFCPKCKKHVEPAVPDALPNATLGHHVVSLTSWFHYGLGVTIAQVVDILGYHLQTRLTPGGLINMWRRLAVILEPWYRQIAEEALRSSHLHADETGWRVSGQTQWLWCFANAQVCYYMIDRSRGGPALQKFFTESFEGVLITDFWRAYDGVCADGRQFCLVHLLRELEKVDVRNATARREAGNPKYETVNPKYEAGNPKYETGNPKYEMGNPREAADTGSPRVTGSRLGTSSHGAEWQAFAKKLRRLIRDAIRLRKRPDFTRERYWSRIVLIHQRLDALAVADYEDADARRLSKRLLRTSDHLWTFLDEPEIPFENNFAERMIRPAVILRKNSQSNRSEQGAATQAVLMSIYRTLKLRGLNPTKTIAQTLKTYLTTSQLPPLPPQITANG